MEVEQAATAKLAFSTKRQSHSAWPLAALGQGLKGMKDAFYPCSDFYVYREPAGGLREGGQPALAFHPYLLMSENHFHRVWTLTAHRRLKNVVVVLEWLPDVESIKVKMGVAAGLPGVPAAEEALCAALRRCADAEPTWEIEKVNHDGLRCAAGPDGWLIIRGSLHEPSVSVQTESDVAGGTAAICATLLKYVNEGEGFEVAPLAKAGAAAAPARTPAAAPSGEGGEADFGAPPEGFVWAEGVF